jgi:two-component system nitrogen regulation sensor histidine kinase GlnL
VPQQLQSILEAVVAGIIVIDEGGRVELVNSEACRMLRISAESMLGVSMENLLGRDHAVAALSHSVRQSGRPAIEDEVSIDQPPPGKSLVADVAASPRQEPSGEVTGVVITLRDVTIRKSLRDTRSQHEQLAAFGRIATGIAHELKNPLGGIRGAGELLAAWAEEERAHQTAGLIVREVDRITALVDELMIFAQGEALETAPLNLHKVLDGVLDLLAMDALREGVEMKRAYDPSIPELLADERRLSQVFLNLARNALQAIEDRPGRLTVGTRISLDHPLASESGRRLPTVVVTVTDTGPGISQAILERMATPFFTTKDRGTGLGLAISRYWVARHGGTLTVASQIGQGTEIRVALPMRRTA